MAYIRALVISAYKEINCLISQPKHYVVGTLQNRRNEKVLLSTKNCTLNLMCKKILRFYTKELCLSRLWFIQYTDMIQLSAQVELVELETLQEIVKSN